MSSPQIVDIWQAYFSRDVNTTPLATSFNERLQAFLSEGMNQAASVLQAEETYQAFTGLDAVISVMNEEGRELSAMVNQLIAQKQEAAEAMAMPLRWRARHRSRARRRPGRPGISSTKALSKKKRATMTVKNLMWPLE